MNTEPIPSALGLGDSVIRMDTPNGRFYRLSSGVELPSVTSILDGIRNVGLELWRASYIQKELLNIQDQVLSIDDISNVLSGPDRVAQEAAKLGSRVHGAIDEYLSGGSFSCSDTEDPLLEGAMAAFMKWRSHPRFKDWVYLESETAVYNADPEFAFAGTVDAIFRDPDGDLGDLFVVDWKTSGGLYQSMFAQVSAYAYALEDMLSTQLPNTFSNSNGNGHGSSKLSNANVRSMVVRFCKEYPITDGVPDRTQPKAFNGRVHYAISDEDFDSTDKLLLFQACYNLRGHDRVKGRYIR